MLSSRPPGTSRPWRDDPASFRTTRAFNVGARYDAPGILSAPSRVCQEAWNDLPALHVYDNGHCCNNVSRI